jgi:signal transduction histidine kinase
VTEGAAAPSAPVGAERTGPGGDAEARDGTEVPHGDGGLDLDDGGVPLRRRARRGARRRVRRRVRISAGNDMTLAATRADAARTEGGRMARRRRWLRRANDAEAWLSAHRPDRRVRWLIVGLGIASVVLILVFDRRTSLSLAILSVIPILGVTLTVSAGAGFLLVLTGAVTGVLADTLGSTARGVGDAAADGIVLLVCFTLAVVVVAGLRAAFADSRRSDQRSRDFLGFVAHQLRTPVSGIRSNAEALILAGEPPEREHLLTNLAAESDRIGRLMTSLLQISRLDQGALFTREPVDVALICQGEAERARQRVGERVTVTVDTSRAPAGPVELSFDATREALANLVDNATRFAASRLAIECHSDDGGVTIAVGDDGPGLEPGSEEHVFTRFVTLDQRGVGLGLSIARGLCEQQRGRLDYRDQRFVMWLPASRSRRV